MCLISLEISFEFLACYSWPFSWAMGLPFSVAHHFSSRVGWFLGKGAKPPERGATRAATEEEVARFGHFAFEMTGLLSPRS